MTSLMGSRPGACRARLGTITRENRIADSKSEPVAVTSKAKRILSTSGPLKEAPAGSFVHRHIFLLICGTRADYRDTDDRIGLFRRR